MSMPRMEMLSFTDPGLTSQPNLVHVTAFFAGIGGCCTLALAYHRYRMDKQKEAIELERWNAENTVNTYGGKLDIE